MVYLFEIPELTEFSSNIVSCNVDKVTWSPDLTISCTSSTGVRWPFRIWISEIVISWCQKIFQVPGKYIFKPTQENPNSPVFCKVCPLGHNFHCQDHLVVLVFELLIKWRSEHPLKSTELFPLIISTGK